jgi:tRNA/tmRNA/rRNA uracil-C5-methylase (TrmA/RlmC/RlmD family)
VSLKAGHGGNNDRAGTADSVVSERGADGGRRADLGVATIDIENVAYGGGGVGRAEGKVHFVAFTVPGERVLAEVYADRKRFSESRLQRVLEPSPERVKPRCEHFGVCGGCAYQHVPYEVQLRWKREQVRSLFERIGGVKNPPVQEVVPSPKVWGYRNRIRLHSREGRVGFFAKYGRSIVEVRRCEIAEESLNQRLAALKGSAPQEGEILLDERRGKRFFEQTNDAAAEELVLLVERLLAADAGALVDAYCGAGFFGRRLAGRFSKVLGIESNQAAVQEAVRAAGPRERYLCGDVVFELKRALDLFADDGVVLLLDPPASGLGRGVVELLGHRALRQIVYVSCDPATQARDVKAILERGFRLETLVPLDMFPQTADVEVVASLLPVA